MKNILITGSTGFVGRNLIEYQNHLFDDFDILELNRIQIKNNDYSLISKCDVIIHLIGKAHDVLKVSNPEDYYLVNTDLTKNIFDRFLQSNAKTFIYISSIKAVVDSSPEEITEMNECIPISDYGKSKLMAENYIIKSIHNSGKRIFILRPSMIHGPGNKGNLNLLYNLVSKGVTWPLGAFENERSFCSIDNLMFIIKELIECEDVPYGIYNIADDETLSTNDIISILAESLNKKARIWKVSKGLIQSLAKLGDLLRLPLTTERLQKLTESYVVSNQKIKSAIGKDLPVSAKDGLLKTFNFFHTNAQ